MHCTYLTLYSTFLRLVPQHTLIKREIIFNANSSASKEQYIKIELCMDISPSCLAGVNKHQNNGLTLCFIKRSKGTGKHVGLLYSHDLSLSEWEFVSKNTCVELCYTHDWSEQPHSILKRIVQQWKYAALCCGLSAIEGVLCCLEGENKSEIGLNSSTLLLLLLLLWKWRKSFYRIYTVCDHMP